MNAPLERASCPKSIPTKRLSRVSTPMLGGGSPSICENRPPDWASSLIASGGAVDTGGETGGDVASRVGDAVGEIPCAATGTFGVKTPETPLSGKWWAKGL